jgi:hypothetical protein
VVFFGSPNAGQTIIGFDTPVVGFGFKKVADGTAHGGAVVNDEDSGNARAGHKRRLLLSSVRHNTDLRIFFILKRFSKWPFQLKINRQMFRKIGEE